MNNFLSKALTLASGVSDSQARAAANRNGYAAVKSRKSPSGDNLGGFMLVERTTNRFVAGERFDLSSEDVVEFCK